MINMKNILSDVEKRLKSITDNTKTDEDRKKHSLFVILCHDTKIEYFDALEYTIPEMIKKAKEKKVEIVWCTMSELFEKI